MIDVSEAVEACAGDAACGLLRGCIRALSHQCCMHAGRCTTVCMRCTLQSLPMVSADGQAGTTDCGVAWG